MPFHDMRFEKGLQFFFFLKLGKRQIRTRVNNVKKTTGHALPCVPPEQLFDNGHFLQDSDNVFQRSSESYIF